MVMYGNFIDLNNCHESVHNFSIHYHITFNQVQKYINMGWWHIQHIIVTCLHWQTQRLYSAKGYLSEIFVLIKYYDQGVQLNIHFCVIHLRCIHSEEIYMIVSF